jgi:uncharacterized protein YndB with AHSA1/START domain
MRAIGASDVIVQEISIEAAAATIFEALTDPEQVVQWWGIERIPRDRSTDGAGVQWKRGLGEDPTESLVRIELTERAGVTDLRLTHSGPVTRALREKNSGWPLVLGALKAFTEKRKD